MKTVSSPDEIANRKKHFNEMEKRKKDLEEDQSKRGKSGAKNATPGRPGSSIK